MGRRMRKWISWGEAYARRACESELECASCANAQRQRNSRWEGSRGAANLESAEVGGGGAPAIGLEWLLEEGARGGPVTERVRHGLLAVVQGCVEEGREEMIFREIRIQREEKTQWGTKFAGLAINSGLII